MLLKYGPESNKASLSMHKSSLIIFNIANIGPWDFCVLCLPLEVPKVVQGSC